MGFDLIGLMEQLEQLRRCPQPLNQIHDEVMVEMPMVTQVGQVYLHLKSGIPVRVTGERVKCWNGDGYVWLYPIESLLDDNTSNVARADLGDHPLNAMEVLAWAAS